MRDITPAIEELHQLLAGPRHLRPRRHHYGPVSSAATFPIILTGMWESEGARTEMKWFDTREIVADRPDLFYFLSGLPRKPLVTADGRHRFGLGLSPALISALFIISREAKLSKHRRHLHIYGVVE